MLSKAMTSPTSAPSIKRRRRVSQSLAFFGLGVIAYFNTGVDIHVEDSVSGLRRLSNDAEDEHYARDLTLLPKRIDDFLDRDRNSDSTSMKDAPRLLSMSLASKKEKESDSVVLSLKEALLYAEFSGMIPLALGSGIRTEESTIDHLKLVPQKTDRPGLDLEDDLPDRTLRDLRDLSTYLGNGECEWEEGKPISTPVYSTFLVGFPGTGKRIAWQLIEGLTGAIAGDDWNHSEHGYNVVSMKGAFPHHESSQWLWSDQMQQSILMIRNPRDTLISYRDVRYEINYSPTWAASHPFNMYTYLKQEPISNFDAWKRAGSNSKYGNNGHLEIRMWAWHIDWWMEGGLRRNLNHTVEHHQVFDHTNANGTDIYRNEPISPPQYWKKCADGSDPSMECRPAAIVSFEGLHSNTTGPSEMAILGNALLGKPGVDVITSDAWSCVFEKSMAKTLEFEHRGMDYRMSTEGGPLPKSFDDDQIQQMIVQMEYIRDKYSQSKWTDGPMNTQSQKLVSIINGYLAEPYFANHVYTGDMPEDDPRFPDGQIEASYTLEQLYVIGDQITSDFVLSEPEELTLPTE